MFSESGRASGPAPRWCSSQCFFCFCVCSCGLWMDGAVRASAHVTAPVMMSWTPGGSCPRAGQMGCAILRDEPTCHARAPVHPMDGSMDRWMDGSILTPCLSVFVVGVAPVRSCAAVIHAGYSHKDKAWMHQVPLSYHGGLLPLSLRCHRVRVAAILWMCVTCCMRMPLRALL